MSLHRDVGIVSVCSAEMGENTSAIPKPVSARELMRGVKGIHLGQAA